MSTKLYLGFAAPALALLGIGMFSLYSFYRIDHQIGTIYDDRVIPLQQLKTIADHYGFSVIDSVNKAHAGIITPQEAQRVIAAGMDEIQSTWAEYRRTRFTADEERLAQDVEALFVTVNAYLEELQRVLRTNDRTQLDRYDGPLYVKIDPVVNKIQELSKLQIEVAKQERLKAAEIYQWTRVVFIIILVLALLLASPLGYLISRLVTATLKDTINKVAKATMEIASATEEHERVAAQQAASVQQTTTTMDELNAFAQSSAQQAEAVATQAQESRNLADNGTKAAQETLQSIYFLKEKVEAIAQQISQLSGQAQQIGAISGLVSELANQTNMLALNAAVEAVRAGEEGKGFAIVAAEIRKLADQSKQSSERINLLVADIQTAINNTVVATEAGTQTVDTSVTTVQASSDAFAKVAQATDHVVFSSQQIALSAEQQVKAIREVLDAMHTINRSAVETTRSIAQTKLGTQQLNEIVTHLQAMV
ncbi:HAMP domain-containing methyl-accepting chemotaxis protein [Trichothermofontia sp.]